MKTACASAQPYTITQFDEALARILLSQIIVHSF